MDKRPIEFGVMTDEADVEVFEAGSREPAICLPLQMTWWYAYLRVAESRWQVAISGHPREADVWTMWYDIVRLGVDVDRSFAFIEMLFPPEAVEKFKRAGGREPHELV